VSESIEGPRSNATPDEARDAHLREALRHAPDAAVGAPPALSSAILRQAREASAPRRPGSSRPAPKRFGSAWSRLWSWLAQPSVATGFAGLMVATLVGLMWWDQPMDETRIEARAPAAARGARVPSPAPSPVLAPVPAPDAGLQAPAAPSTAATPEPAQVAQATPAVAASPAPASARKPVPAPATSAELEQPKRADKASAGAPERSRSDSDSAQRSAAARSVGPSAAKSDADAGAKSTSSSNAAAAAGTGADGQVNAKARATAPSEAETPADSGTQRSEAAPATAGAARVVEPGRIADAVASPVTPASPLESKRAPDRSVARPDLPREGRAPAAQAKAAPELAAAAGDTAATTSVAKPPVASARLSAPAAMPPPPASAAPSTRNPVGSLRSAIDAAPQAWTWQRGSGPPQPLNDALRAWLAQLDTAAAPHWQAAAARGDSGAAPARPLRLFRLGQPHTTVTVDADGARLETTSEASMAASTPGTVSARAALSPDATARLRAALELAAPAP
jgi:hypothetical protein